MSALRARADLLVPRSADIPGAVAAIDWECATAETRYLTHDIHRYSSKYIPQIARQAIELLADPGELVLDPMVGSGTTLVEAWLSGRRSLGLDVNPLAVLISRVKSRRVDSSLVDKAVAELVELAATLESVGGGQLQLSSSSRFEAAFSSAQEDPRLHDPWFKKWFQPQILADLLILDHEIARLTDERVRDLARVALSDILRRSSNAHSGYPNVMFNRRTPEKPRPGPIFARTLLAYTELVKKLEALGMPEPEVALADARSTGLEECSVDAIVSHPPYIGSVPYAEYGVLSLKWMGADARELDAELLGGRRQSRDVVERFYTSYGTVLAEGFRVLRPGRGMFLMVGDPVVRGTLIDLAVMTRELAASAGFEEVTSTIRQGVNRRANKMAHETLLFFEKPA